MGIINFIKNIGKKPESYISKEGYKHVYKPASRDSRDNGFVAEHRDVMGKKLGRKLNSSEIVHHKDGNKLNNKSRNLELMSKKEHFKTHNTKKTR